MPVCVRSAFVGAIGNGTTVYLQNDSKVIVEPLTNPRVLILDPAVVDVAKCVFVGLSGAEYQALIARVGVLESRPGGATPEPIDYTVASSFWAFGLSTVVTLYLVSKYVGEIVGFIRTVIR